MVIFIAFIVTEGYYYQLQNARIKQLVQEPAAEAVERELSNM